MLVFYFGTHNSMSGLEGQPNCAAAMSRESQAISGNCLIAERSVPDGSKVGRNATDLPLRR